MIIYDGEVGIRDLLGSHEWLIGGMFRETQIAYFLRKY